MRLFIRHILRSIRKSPLQPLFIVLSLAIAVTALSLSVRTALEIREVYAEKNGADNYVCDLTVRPSAKSGIGLILDRDVREAIGERGSILGEFELSVTTDVEGEKRLDRLIAAPLTEADRFFGFRYSEYGEFTREELSSSIILSSEAARERGLSVGDALSVELLGYTLDFTVEAVALSEGGLASSLGYIDITAVAEELARRNPALASTSEELFLYSAVRIRLDEGEDAKGVADMLKSTPALADANIIIESENTGNLEAQSTVAAVITEISALIVTLLSTTVITTSLHLLNKRRRQETALFKLSGAEPGQLAALRYLEAAVYGFLGAAASLVLMLPTSALINTLFEWEEGITPGIPDILITLVLSPALMLLITLVDLKRTREVPVAELVGETAASTVGEPPRRLRVAVTASLSALLILGFFIIPPRLGYLIAAPAIAVFVLTAFDLSPIIIRGVTGLAAGLFSRQRRLPPRLYLAARSIRSSHPLLHIGRMLSIVFTVIISLTFCLTTTSRQLENVKEAFDADLVSYNVTGGGERRIRESGLAEAVYRFGIIERLTDREGAALICYAVDAEALENVNPALKPKAAPEVDCVAISHGAADMNSVDVGDILTVRHEAIEYSLRVTEIIDCSANIIFLHPDTARAEHELLCTRAKEGKAEELRALLREMEAMGSVTLEEKEVTSKLTGYTDEYVGFIGYATAAAVLVAIFGMINLFISEHISRRGELLAMYTAGMSRRDTLLQELLELLVLAVLALLVALPSAALICHAIDVASTSFGTSLI